MELKKLMSGTGGSSGNDFLRDYRNADSGYSLDDWLSANSLGWAVIEFALSQAKKDIANSPNLNKNSSGESVGMDAEAAWNLAANAMVSQFPQHVQLITQVRNNTVRSFPNSDSDSTPPFTVPQSRGKSAYVVCPYRGTPSNLLSIAHEFGHALQLAASGETKMAAVSREICAFIGEQTLLIYLCRNRSELHQAVAMSWHANNRFYLGECVSQFIKAMENDSSTYHYNWNYPVARVFASVLNRDLLPTQLWRIFQNRVDITRLYQRVSKEASTRPGRNLLPPLFIESSAENRANDNYRVLGSMLLLDLQYKRSNAKQKNIGDYFSDLFKPLQEQNTFLGLDHERRPYFYLCWKTDDLEKTVTVTQQSAPYTRPLNVREILQQRLPEYLALTEGMDNVANGGLVKR